MKKLLTLTIIAVAFLTTNSFAQSNLVWTVKDHIEKGGIKTTTTFNSTCSGFANKTEVDNFIQKIKNYPDVASCDVVSNSGTSCDVKIVMSQPHNKMYYVGMAQKLNITHITFNGVKKSVDEIIKESREHRH